MGESPVRDTTNDRSDVHEEAEERKNEEESDMKVIDLQKLINNEQSEDTKGEETDFQIDYFVLQRHGNGYIDPTDII